MGRRQDWTPVGVLSCVVGAGLSQSPRVKSLRGVGAFFLRMCAFVLSFLLRPMGAMRGSSARTGPLAVGSLGVAPAQRGGGADACRGGYSVILFYAYIILSYESYYTYELLSILCIRA
jgi:hypothetical protein